MCDTGDRCPNPDCNYLYSPSDGCCTKCGWVVPITLFDAAAFHSRPLRVLVRLKEKSVTKGAVLAADVVAVVQLVEDYEHVVSRARDLISAASKTAGMSTWDEVQSLKVALAELRGEQ